MILSVNGVSLYYEKHGQGQPLIMVHGNGEDHTIFVQAVEKLRAHYTCYLIDSRDHGNSSKTNHLHYEDMAQDMLEFMERLQLDHVIFYGFSDGGIIGLLVAGKTDRIKALIISGANIDPSGIKPWFRRATRWIYRFHKDEKLALMLNEPHISEEYLQTISCPVYVLAGSKDLILESHTNAIAKALPHSSLCILPNEGHGSYIVHSDKIADWILSFRIT